MLAWEPGNKLHFSTSQSASGQIHELWQVFQLKQEKLKYKISQISFRYGVPSTHISEIINILDTMTGQ